MPENAADGKDVEKQSLLLENSSSSAGESWFQKTRNSRNAFIAILAVLCVVLSLVLSHGFHTNRSLSNAPLIFALCIGGLPLIWELLGNVFRREFGSDLLAGISIVTSVLLGEYLAGVIVVLMLSGGEALEGMALRSASSVLSALAKRMPMIAHRREGKEIHDIPLSEIAVDDSICLYPYETCPVDGNVIEGRGVIDESYLTGEPFLIEKVPGSAVLSGSINGGSLLVVRATRKPSDSRYAKIMKVMRESEQQRPRLRRIGDQLGAFYTPLAVSLAVLAWLISGDPIRFLAVLVIATPCPLLIAIPVAVIGSISLCAKRAIIVKDSVALEQISQCRTAIFDKTGTLTYGRPSLTEQIVAPEFDSRELLGLVAAVERFSKHPLAEAVAAAARQEGIYPPEVANVSEEPGQGLTGEVGGHRVRVVGRKHILRDKKFDGVELPPISSGLECIILLDERYAATYRFRDAPRDDGRPFIAHLGIRHGFNHVMIVSGDRKAEVSYLAEEVGIKDVRAEQSPEEKLAIVRSETEKAKTLYVGDGINDAPAMLAATVGMAMGHSSDVTAEAAGVVVMDNSLTKVDEFMHIGRRMRSIALQSAVGGMVLSIGGMILAMNGYLTPVQGALAQEAIDVFAVLNALRAAKTPGTLVDI